MTQDTEDYAIGIDGSRRVYVRNADGSWPAVPTRIELASAPAGDGVEPLVAELRNPWEGLPNGLGMKRGECPQWACDLMQRAANALARPHSAVAPAGDGVEDRDALAERLCAARFPTTVARHPDYYRVQLTEESRERWRVVADAALARPRAAVGERPDDEALDLHLPDTVKSERRCGIQRSDWMTSWFVPWSPRNDNQNAEGPWSHWVALARAIIAADEKAILALQFPPAKEKHL